MYDLREFHTWAEIYTNQISLGVSQNKLTIMSHTSRVILFTKLNFCSGDKRSPRALCEIIQESSQMKSKASQAEYFHSKRLEICDRKVQVFCNLI